MTLLLLLRPAGALAGGNGPAIGAYPPSPGPAIGAYPAPLDHGPGPLQSPAPASPAPPVSPEAVIYCGRHPVACRQGPPSAAALARQHAQDLIQNQKAGQQIEELRLQQERQEKRAMPR